MRVLPASFAAAVALAPALASQSFEIEDGNVRLVRHPRAVPGLFSSVFSATPCAESHLHGNEWCYSIGGSGVGRAIDGTGHGDYARTTLGSVALQQDIEDLDGLGLLDVTVVDSVASTGAERGILVTTATFSNVSDSPVGVRIYNFCNVDLNDTCCGEYGDYSLACSGPQRFSVADAEDCGGLLVCDAPGAHSFQAEDPATLAAAIVAGAPLTSGGLPFGSPDDPVDFAGAFGWQVTLAPAATFSCAVTIESIRTGTAPAITHTGLSIGGATIPTLHSLALPRIGASIELEVRDAGSSATVLLLSVGAPAVQVPLLGLAVLAPPIAAAIPLTVIGGEATYALDLACDPALGGTSVAAQVFVADPTSPASLPLSHSDVLVATIGD